MAARCCVPLLVAAYFCMLRRKKKAALRYASLAMVREAMGAGAAVAPPRAAAAVPARARAHARRGGAPGRGRHAAVAARDDHPRDGRVGQHARRPTSSPTGWPRRRTPPRPSSPSSRATSRIGIVAFAGTAARGAAADAQPRGPASPRSTASSCSAAPPSAAASSSSLKTHLPRRRLRPALDQSAHECAGQRPASGRSARRTARRRQGGAQAGAARLVQVGRDHPAHRRPDARPGPTRSRRRRWPPIAACASTPSASARRTARSSASKAGRCACASTRRR